MEIFQNMMAQSGLKLLLIGRLNVIVLCISVGSLIILISAWGAAIAAEHGVGLARRYAASFIAAIFQLVATVMSYVAHRTPPGLTFLYTHQFISILGLLLTGIAMGMNDVAVNVCANPLSPTLTVACGAHYAELVGEIAAAIALMITFAASQQRVTSFIDKGILDGMQGRSNGMQQLP